MPPTSPTLQTPLPLTSTLRDLAVLRAASIDLSTLPDPSSDSPTTNSSSPRTKPEVQKSVQDSSDYIREVRAAIRLEQSGRMEAAGENIEKLLQTMDELTDELKDTDSLGS